MMRQIPIAEAVIAKDTEAMAKIAVNKAMAMAVYD